MTRELEGRRKRVVRWYRDLRAGSNPAFLPLSGSDPGKIRRFENILIGIYSQFIQLMEPDKILCCLFSLSERAAHLLELAAHIIIACFPHHGDQFFKRFIPAEFLSRQYLLRCPHNKRAKLKMRAVPRQILLTDLFQRITDLRMFDMPVDGTDGARVRIGNLSELRPEFLGVGT